MSKHTPGLLTVQPRESDSRIGQVCHERKVFIATVSAGFDVSLDEVEANAARLALCWNTHDQLVEALRKLAELYALPGESNTDRFERVAAMYHKETGRMAPGKDVSAASGDDSSLENRVRWWEEWYAQRAADARAALAAAGVA